MTASWTRRGLPPGCGEWAQGWNPPPRRPFARARKRRFSRREVARPFGRAVCATAFRCAQRGRRRSCLQAAITPRRSNWERPASRRGRFSFPPRRRSARRFPPSPRSWEGAPSRRTKSDKLRLRRGGRTGNVPPACAAISPSRRADAAPGASRPRRAAGKEGRPRGLNRGRWRSQGAEEASFAFPTRARCLPRPNSEQKEVGA